jgi:hypothetical protein
MTTRRILCLLALAGLSGCAAFQRDKEQDESPKKTAQEPKLVGRVASIPADRRFVLIQSYGNWNIASGTVLTTRGLEERTANLRVTGETLGQFAAADVQSGSVEIGDAVYTSHVPKPPEPDVVPAAEPEMPENQLAGETGNVQKNN